LESEKLCAKTPECTVAITIDGEPYCLAFEMPINPKCHEICREYEKFMQNPANFPKRDENMPDFEIDDK
jgi:hypothetical protein